MTNQRHRVVLFADISGSSALYKSVGNEKAKAIIDEAVADLCLLSEQNAGRVVKTIGDEVMSRFDDPIDAFNAARSMQSHYTEKTLSIRIGMAYGSTLLDKGDVFGDTVNDAAFISHISRGKQILLNENFFESLPEVLSNQCKEFDQVTIKGESDLSTIYRVDWESQCNNEERSTRLFTSKGFEDLSQITFLNLSLSNNHFTLTKSQTPYKIGRDLIGVDLTVSSNLASRSHCEIRFQHGKFVLADHSSNGTFIKPTNNQAVYLRREEFPLTGEGVISLGGPIELCEELIRYKLE
ncbi:MAG: adenylate/guanylate cyclase domain-containing protein [Kangiellaceae bacterium]|nr:adenylate/guanylate cyclase domain-containing protein [Kangiellaceae bacterium]MCW8997662.1 adenylate/guanylate cyclase domain-containing protein [Kangiellaceae bacterium]MCW9017247.1 adenylate/guanylate cyclase domain-containing protein [Kangiellaceae bacterium]